MTVSVCETVESVRVLYTSVALLEDRLCSNESSERRQASFNAEQLPGLILVVVTDEMILDETIEEGKVEFPKAMVGNNHHEFLALWCYLTFKR